MTYLQQHIIEFIALIVAIFALIVACSARFYAKKAFALALFDKRYKLYDDFKIFLNDMLSNIDKRPAAEHLRRVKFLLWEAQYIFGKDINDLLIQMKECTVGAIVYFDLANDMASSFKDENAANIALLHKYRVQCDQLYSSVGALLSDNESTNLISYFDKYLADNDFKKPLSKTFWQMCQKLWSKLFCSCC